MPLFELEIVTPEKVVYSGMVERVQAPGSEGWFGVLPRHLPMLTALKTGPLTFVEQGSVPRKLTTSGGFAEVQRDRVTMLADTAEFSEQIDVDRARQARDRALSRLTKATEEKDLDVPRAQAALVRALNRLKVAGAG